jgi:hypothetical protein
MIEIADIPAAVSAPAPKLKKPARKSQPGIGGLVNFALMAWMMWDLRKRSDAELNGKRKLWFVAAFVPPFGPIAYIIYLRRRKTQAVEIPVEVTDQA